MRIISVESTKQWQYSSFQKHRVKFEKWSCFWKSRGGWFQDAALKIFESG